MRLIGQYERWIVEGSAGVALAGLLKMKDQYQNKKVAIVLCGRNIMLDKYLNALNE